MPDLVVEYVTQISEKATDVLFLVKQTQKNTICDIRCLRAPRVAVASVQIICTLFQTDNHASISSLNFYRPDALPDTQPTEGKTATQKIKPRICVLGQLSLASLRVAKLNTSFGWDKGWNVTSKS